MAGQPFCRLTVLAPRQRVDVALPSDVPVAELVPMVLELVGEPGRAVAPQPWRLSGIVGGPLPAAATLGELGVLDGELLRLGPAIPVPAAPVFDDPVDAIAAGAAGGGRGHRFEVAAVLTLAVAAAVLLGAAGPGSVPAALLAGAGAVAAVAAPEATASTGSSNTGAAGTGRAGPSRKSSPSSTPSSPSVAAAGSGPPAMPDSRHGRGATPRPGSPTSSSTIGTSSATGTSEGSATSTRWRGASTVSLQNGCPATRAPFSQTPTKCRGRCLASPPRSLPRGRLEKLMGTVEVVRPHRELPPHLRVSWRSRRHRSRRRWCPAAC